MREYLSGLATAPRILKNVIYGKLIAIRLYSCFLGAIRGDCYDSRNVAQSSYIFDV